jgi:hypothetical protein
MADSEITLRKHGHARRSVHVYTAVLLAFVAAVVWGYSRATVCWGQYGLLGEISCHTQWGTFVALIGAVISFGLLLIDLATPHLDKFAGRSLQRSRASWHGYRQLQGREFVHVTLSTIFLAISLLFFFWIVLLSPIRF